jgi:nitrogen fixation NifU-like protein
LFRRCKRRVELRSTDSRWRLSPHDLDPDIYNFNSMYSPQLLDHFQHPRNAGDVADADAVAEIANPVCGDVLRLSLKVDGGRIAQIGFKSKGCVPSMACASALTEMVAGKSLVEARTVTERRDDLIAAVGGLPQASTHAAQLALDALASILEQLKA